MDLPSWSPFPELYEQAKRNPQYVMLYDYARLLSQTSGQLILNVDHARKHLYESLDAEKLSKLRSSDTLTPPGYEFVVYMLAILSLGAAICPLSQVILPEKARYFVSISKGVAVVYSKLFSNSAASIKADFASDDSDILSKIPFIEIDTTLPANSTILPSFNLHQQPHHRPSRAGSLLFTSGTSGRPRGVVHSYDAIISAAEVRARTRSLSNTDVLLNQKPGNWIGGFYGILPCLLVGARIEFCADVFNPEWLWNRVKEGDVSIIDTLSDTWEKIALHFEEKIDVLDKIERRSYVKAIRNVKWATVGGAPLARHVQQWWTSLRGKALTNQYGAAEVMPISQSSSDLASLEEKVQCSVGTPLPGAEIKLIDGELRVKAPWMFSRKPRLRRILQTGDCAEIINELLIVHGRSSIDTIRFCGWNMHASAVENALHALPYISKSIVLAIPDDSYHERVGAIISLKSDTSFQIKPTLKQLHEDLAFRTDLPKFKLPTVAYWLGDGEEVPRTQNRKLSKLKARQAFFGPGMERFDQVEVLDLEGVWESGEEKWKPWDWDGIS